MAIPFESNLASIAVIKLAQRLSPRSALPVGSINVALTIVDNLTSKPSLLLMQASPTTIDASLSLFNMNQFSADVLQRLECKDFPYAGKDSQYAKPELLTEWPDTHQSSMDVRLPVSLETEDSAPMKANDGTTRNTDALTSYLMQDNVGITANSRPTPNVVQPNGKISLTCVTYRATATTPEYFLLDSEKLSPGWFSNVNWSDNDNDGWNTIDAKETANPSAVYTPDKEDSGVAGGDPDLRKFVITLTDTHNTPNANYSVKLTWSSLVRVYENQDKSGRIEPGGATSHTFTTADMNPTYLEGLDINSG